MKRIEFVTNSLTATSGVFYFNSIFGFVNQKNEKYKSFNFSSWSAGLFLSY